MNAYDVYANPLNISRRQIATYGSDIEFFRYPTNNYGEPAYDEEPETFTLRGLFHSGTGKMGSATAIRFAYTSDAGLGLGQSDSGVMVLYDENNLPQTGDICYLLGQKFYVRIITDILVAHKILDISLEIVGVVTP